MHHRRAADRTLLANMVEKGRTPVLTKPELESIGYRLAIFPVTAMLAARQAMAGAYAHLAATGRRTAIRRRLRLPANSRN
ncbi:MAG: hypothetical protein IPL06_18615 [Betaproteobacteria bacterium]|nr:hypothetical protein [Betaproteobacteria bacterium]